MIERLKVRPGDGMEAIRAGRTWTVTLPGGKGSARYTDSELREMFAVVSDDPHIEEFWAEPRSFEIEIPTTPSPDVRPNRNTGFNAWQGKKAREEKARLREVAKNAAVSAMNAPEALDRRRPLYGDDAVVEVTVWWEKRPTPKYPNGRYRSFVDGHDTLPQMCKGLIDGLVDAAVLKDDKRLFASYRQDKDPSGQGRVVVKVMDR
jgi:hypothetical protein